MEQDRVNRREFNKGINVKDTMSLLNKKKNILKDKENKQKIVPRSEIETVGKILYQIGLNAYCEEYFNDIKLENQIIPQVEGINNPKETTSFKLGYERGKVIVKYPNLLPEQYRNIETKKIK